MIGTLGFRINSFNLQEKMDFQHMILRSRRVLCRNIRLKIQFLIKLKEKKIIFYPQNILRKTDSFPFFAFVQPSPVAESKIPNLRSESKYFWSFHMIFKQTLANLW